MAALNAALDDGADAPPSPQPVEAATAAAAAAGTASDAAALACAGWTTATTLCILRHVAAMSRAGDLTADEKAAVKSGAARMHGFLLGAALLFDETDDEAEFRDSLQAFARASLADDAASITSASSHHRGAHGAALHSSAPALVPGGGAPTMMARRARSDPALSRWRIETAEPDPGVLMTDVAEAGLTTSPAAALSGSTSTFGYRDRERARRSPTDQ